MRLYIMRHAWAGEFGDPRYPRDRDRPLTDDGRKRFRKWLRGLEQQCPRPDWIFSSPYVRCAQTAELWCEFLADRGHAARVCHLEELGCGADPAQVARLLTADTPTTEIAAVGHMPDVAWLTGRLTGRQEDIMPFKKAAVVRIDFPGEVALGNGRLEWYLSPKAAGY